MCGLRFIVALLLLVAVTQSNGSKLKDVAQRIVNTLKAPAPDSNIKGRLLTAPEGCGLPKLTAIKRIVGGGPAKDGAWPWMTLLGSVKGDRFYFHCGGSLITTRHVLSAAHCFVNKIDHVRLGEYDYLSSLDGKHTVVAVKNVTVHEHYEAKTFINDIAIVYLAKDVEFTDRIRPICLPTSEELRSRSFVGTNPFAAGWGHLKEKTKMTNILQQAQVPVIGNEECKKNYRDNVEMQEGAKYRFNESYVLCTGFSTGGVSPCQGDSGGPLMLPIFEHGRFPYYQIGIVSYAFGCARPNLPNVYVNVQKYIDWIIEKLE